MKFCNQCGQGNMDDATFCIQCGASLEPEKAEGKAAAPLPGVAPPPSAVPPPGTIPPSGAVPPPPGVPLQAPGMRPGVPPGAPGPMRPPRPQLPTDGLAVASLVLSIFSFLACPVVAAILGIIFGYMSLTNIEESRGALGGSELARAGIIIGWVHMALAVLIGIFILIMVLIAATR